MPCASVIVGSLFGAIALGISAKLSHDEYKKNNRKLGIWWAFVTIALIVLIAIYLVKYFSCSMDQDTMALLKPGTQQSVMPEFKKIGKPFDTLPDALAPWAIGVELRYPGTKFGP